mgnify:CR=1 FL=1
MNHSSTKYLVDTILEKIEEMRNSGIEEIRKHAETLLGPRTRLAFHDISEWDVVQDGCEAYILYLNEVQQDVLDPRVGAMPAKDVFPESIVSIREGAHGPELFVDEAPGERAKTSVITIILGPSHGKQVVFTWHPGEPAEPFDGTTIKPHTAVKLHNGE